MKKRQFKILFVILLISLNIWDINHTNSAVRSFGDVIFSFRGVSRLIPFIFSIFFIFGKFRFRIPNFSNRVLFFTLSFIPSILIFENVNLTYSLLRWVELFLVTFSLLVFYNYLKNDFIKLFMWYNFIIMISQPLIGLFIDGFFIVRPDFITGVQLQGKFPVLNSNGYATAASIVLLFFLRTNRFFNWKIISLILILILTFSRSTIFGLAIVSMIYFINLYELKAIKFLAFLITGFSVSLLINDFMILMIRGNENQFYSLTGRTYFWEEAYKYILNRPIFGSGYASSTRYLVMPNSGHEAASTLHNTWIEILLAGGIFSFFSFIFMVKSTFKKLLFNSNFWYSAILIVVIFKSFTNTLFMYNDGIILFFILFGLSKYDSNKLAFSKKNE